MNKRSFIAQNEKRVRIKTGRQNGAGKRKVKNGQISDTAVVFSDGIRVLFLLLSEKNSGDSRDFHKKDCSQDSDGAGCAGFCGSGS